MSFLNTPVPYDIRGNFGYSGFSSVAEEFIRRKINPIKQYFLKEKIQGNEMNLKNIKLKKNSSLFQEQKITMPKKIMQIIDKEVDHEARRQMIQACKSYLDLQNGPRYKKGAIIKYTLLGSPEQHLRYKKSIEEKTQNLFKLNKFINPMQRRRHTKHTSTTVMPNQRHTKHASKTLMPNKGYKRSASYKRKSHLHSKSKCKNQELIRKLKVVKTKVYQQVEKEIRNKLKDNTAFLTLKAKAKTMKLKRKKEYNKTDVLDYFKYVKTQMKKNQQRERYQIRKLRISQRIQKTHDERMMELFKRQQETWQTDLQTLQAQTNRPQKDMIMNQVGNYRLKREFKTFANILQNPLQKQSQWNKTLRTYKRGGYKLNQLANTGQFDAKSVTLNKDIAKKYSKFSVIRSQSTPKERQQPTHYLCVNGFYTERSQNLIKNLYDENKLLHKTFNPRISKNYFGLSVLILFLFNLFQKALRSKQV